MDRLRKKTTGKGVKVAVIDSGVNTDHEDLEGVVSKAKDFSGLGKDGTTPIGGKTTIHHGTAVAGVIAGQGVGDRKSTRLNSSHVAISYAVFCLKKKTTTTKRRT